MREAVITDLPRYSITDKGDVISYVWKKPKVMRAMKSHHTDLLWVGLAEQPEPGAGKSIYHTRYVHKLVAEAFVKNPNELAHVQHKDGNLTNNHYANLRWISKAESCQQTVARGNHRMATLTIDQVLEIKASARVGKASFRKDPKGLQKALATRYGVSVSVIYSLLTGSTWFYV